MNLARKYRPKVLSELIGQASVTRVITNAITSDSLHQAYLFVGSPGSGKTTTARLLAAMENCSTSPGVNPCGKCENCKRIFEGTHVDIIEVDAASGAGGVKEIRKLKKDASFNAVDGCKIKYFIIDESHRMSPEANDALLKLLEEPPPRVRFVMCTTDVHKMRPAIQSRCQRHDFGHIYWSQISDNLKAVAKNEKVDFEDEALHLCGKVANGSMRDGLQLLERLIGYVGTGKKLTSALAAEMFKAVPTMLYYDLVDQIIGDEKGKPDASEGFRVINKMLQGGVDFENIYQGLANHLRNMLVKITASQAGEFITLAEDAARRMNEQCVKCQKGGKLKAIFRCIHALNKAKQSTVYNIPAEVALQTWFVESVVFFREKTD